MPVTVKLLAIVRRDAIISLDTQELAGHCTMAIPSQGTFECVAVVPDRSSTVFSCPAQLDRTPEHGGSCAATVRLLGPAPQLHVSDAGATLNPGPLNPATQRRRLMLRASGRQHASAAETFFFLDRGVVAALRAGDHLHMARTSCGRIGVSAIRSGQLIFAVGAVTAVPLGSDFQASIPSDLIREAEALFRKRDSKFEFVEYPIEIRAEGESRTGYRGTWKHGSFEVHVLHGHHNGMPGTNECLSVVRAGACSFVDANSSALFLDTDAFNIVRW